VAPLGQLPTGCGSAEGQGGNAPTARSSPHSHGTQYNLVLVLKPAGTKGTARSVDVFYRAAGQEYHLQTTTRIEVLAGRACT
jgi:hypothetical protein